MLTGYLFNSWHVTALAQYQAKQYPEALALCEQRLFDYSQDAVAWQLKGTILEALNRSDEAVVAYQQAIAHDPEQAESYAQLGELWDRAGGVPAPVRSACCGSSSPRPATCP